MGGGKFVNKLTVKVRLLYFLNLLKQISEYEEVIIRYYGVGVYGV